MLKSVVFHHYNLFLFIVSGSSSDTDEGNSNDDDSDSAEMDEDEGIMEREKDGLRSLMGDRMLVCEFSYV